MYLRSAVLMFCFPQPQNLSKIEVFWGFRLDYWKLSICFFCLVRPYFLDDSKSPEIDDSLSFWSWVSFVALKTSCGSWGKSFLIVNVGYSGLFSYLAKVNCLSDICWFVCTSLFSESGTFLESAPNVPIISFFLLFN